MSNKALASILLAKDLPSIRELCQVALEEEGYEAMAVEDGRQALMLLDSTQLVDLLFTDVAMPSGVDGVYLALRARQLRTNLKILMTSGTVAHRFLKKGCIEFFSQALPLGR